LIDLPEQEELFYAHAQAEHYDFVPVFHRTAFEEFDVLIKVRSETNTAGAHVDRRQSGWRSATRAWQR
jgi:hypothetical protein